MLNLPRKHAALALGWACATALTATAFAAADETTATRPNILWISCEDMSPDIDCYGESPATTPHLDQLARDGEKFNLAFSSGPVCSVSRSSIITGMYASTLGTQNHRSKVDLLPGVRTFTAYLRDAGYYCTNNVKTDYNFDVPKDAWDEVSNKAHWRNRQDKSKPFFSVFNITTTHESLLHTNDAEFAERTKDVPDNLRVDPAKVKLPPYVPDTPIVRKDFAKYYDCITQMDIEAGRILDELKEDGLANNTLVVFWSDHGRALPRGKRWLYDTGLRVALLARWPGHIKPGTEDNELVSLMDLAPTMLSFAGVKIPDNMQARIFMGPDKQPEPKYLFFTRDRMDEAYDMMRAVRDHDFKYIKNFYPEKPYDQKMVYYEKDPSIAELRRMHEAGTLEGPGNLFFAKSKPPEELYDLKKDPMELHNLADDAAHKETLETMRNALTQWQKRTKDRGFEPQENFPVTKAKGRKGKGKRNGAGKAAADEE